MLRWQSDVFAQQTNLATAGVALCKGGPSRNHLRSFALLLIRIRPCGHLDRPCSTRKARQWCPRPLSGENSGQARVTHRNMARPPTHVQLRRLHQDVVRPRLASASRPRPVSTRWNSLPGLSKRTSSSKLHSRFRRCPRTIIHRLKWSSLSKRNSPSPAEQQVSRSHEGVKDQTGLPEPRYARPRVGRKLHGACRRQPFPTSSVRSASSTAKPRRPHSGSRFPRPHRNARRSHEFRHRAAGALPLFRRRTASSSTTAKDF